MTSQPDNELAARRAIGIDIGGTKISASVVKDNGRVEHQLAAPTPSEDDDSATLFRTIANLVAELRQACPAVSAIGVGAAGLVDWPAGRIRWAPNNAYRGLDLKQRLTTETGLPTVVDNDANVAAWAEFRLGSGARYDNMLFVTVGTGVGGGIILGDQLYRGRNGLAGEIGHITVNPGGPVCGCGNDGCLEIMASGTALDRLTLHSIEANPHGTLAQLARENHSSAGRLAYRAASSGDPVAIELFNTIGTWLGIGISSLVNAFDFDTVVLGGGLAQTGDLLIEPTRRSFEKRLVGKNHRDVAHVNIGRFTENAGTIGAAVLALDLSKTENLPLTSLSHSR